jgi:agmatinase
MTNLDDRIGGLPPETVAVLGVPFDRNSSFRRGAALAPAAIRQNLFSDASNLFSERGLDIGNTLEWQDVGDVRLPDGPDGFFELERTVRGMLSKHVRLITLGGDHSITYPIVTAYAKEYDTLNILHLDAHPDLYDVFDGSKYSHACPFARIMEKGLATRLVQMGIRAVTRDQRDQATRFGVEQIEMHQGGIQADIAFDGPVYLSIDVDCLDPAHAPGVSHREPGGLTTREVVQLIQNFRGALVGADIVEYNPERDRADTTGMVVAKLLKEILGRMLSA